MKFRKYIRNNYFDIDLLAKDLSLCFWQDKTVVVGEDHIREAFKNAFENMGIGEISSVRLQTPEGCFAVYPEAMEALGDTVGEFDARPYSTGDEWIHDGWPRVKSVSQHLYSQVLEAITPEESTVFYGSQVSAVDRNHFLKNLPEDIKISPIKLANLIEAELEMGLFD